MKKRLNYDAGNKWGTKNRQNDLIYYIITPLIGTS